jgi:MFS family permease
MKDSNFGNLGFYTLGIMYATFGICSFVSAPIVRKLGVKWCIVLGCMTHVLQTGSQILPLERAEHPTNQTLQNMYGFIYGMNICLSAINGFGNSILWVAQGQYIMECANESNKGTYFGIFWVFLQSSLIIGNVMAAFVVDNIPGSVFYMILTALALFCVFYFILFLWKPIPYTSDEETEKALIYS